MPIKIVNQTETEIMCEISGDIYPNKYEFARDNREEFTIPKDIQSTLKENKEKRVVFNINSNGGDVFAGTAISNMIKSHKGETVANIQSIGASIASVIALSCDRVLMPKNAYLMIHKPYCYTMGTAEDLKKEAELLDKIQDNILDVYMGKAKEGIERDTINNFINEETWFNGEEATNYFNIELLEEKEMLNCVTEIKHKKQPSFLDAEEKEVENKKTELPKELLEEIRNLKKYEEEQCQD